MFYDLLVHVDLPDESRFVMALGNINNYLAALNGEPCTVVLLANGGEGPHHQGRPAPLRRSRARRRRGNRPPPTRRLRLHQAVITKTAGASLS